MRRDKKYAPTHLKAPDAVAARDRYDAQNAGAPAPRSVETPAAQRVDVQAEPEFILPTAQPAENPARESVDPDVRPEKTPPEPENSTETEQDTESRGDKAAAAQSAQLFERMLLPTVENVHRIDQKALRAGVAWLLLLPILLLIIRRMTNSSKVAFLLIWVVGMFLISAALIFVGYADHSLKRFLRTVKEYVPDASAVELDSLAARSGLPVPPERLRQLLLRRRLRHSAAESPEEAVELLQIENWLENMEQRGGETRAQHLEDHPQ